MIKIFTDSKILKMYLCIIVSALIIVYITPGAYADTQNNVDKTALGQKITDATTLLNEHKAGSAVGDVSQSAYDTFNAVITTASGINADVNATQAQVDAQVRSLDTQILVFNNSIIEEVLESDHPYQNNYDHTWVKSVPGNPTSIYVAFDPQTEVENGYDKIYVMDKYGNNITGSPFTGKTLGGITVTVPGDTVKIRLTSDYSYTYFGFKVDSIVAKTALEKPFKPLLVNGIASWAAVENENNGYLVKLYKSQNPLITTGQAITTGSAVGGVTVSFTEPITTEQAIGIPSITTVQAIDIPSITTEQAIGTVLTTTEQAFNIQVNDGSSVGKIPILLPETTGQAITAGSLGSLKSTVADIQSSQTMPKGIESIQGINDIGNTLISSVTVHGALSYDFSSLMTTSGCYTVSVQALGTGSFYDSPESDLSEPQVVYGTPILTNRNYFYLYSVNPDLHIFIAGFSGENLTELFGRTFKLVDNQNKVIATSKSDGNWNSDVYLNSNFIGFLLRVIDPHEGNPSGVYKLVIDGLENYYKDEQVITVQLTDKSILYNKLSEANNLLSNHYVGEDDWNVPLNAHDELNTAISAASSVCNDAQATQEQINAQVIALSNAISEFNNAIVHREPMITACSTSSFASGAQYIELTFSGVNLNELNGKVIDLIDDQNHIIATSEKNNNWNGGIYIYGNGSTLRIDMRTIDVEKGMPVGNYKLDIYGLQNYYQNEDVITIHFITDKTALMQKITESTTLLNSKNVGEADGDVPQAVYDTFNIAILAAGGVNSDTAATQVQVDAAAAALISAINAFNDRIIGKTPESDHPYSNSYDYTWTYTVSTSPAAIDVTFDTQTFVEINFDKIYVMDWNGVNIQGSPFTGNSLAGITVTVPGDTVKIRLTSDGSVVGYGFKVTNIAVSTALSKPARPLLENAIVNWTAIENANNGYSLKLYKDGSNLVTTVTTTPGALSYDFSSFMTIPGSYAVTVTALGTGSYRNSPVSDLSIVQIVHGLPMITFRYNNLRLVPGIKNFQLEFGGTNLNELFGKVFKLIDNQNNLIATSESNSDWIGYSYLFNNSDIEFSMRAIDMQNGIPAGDYMLVVDGVQNFYQDAQSITIQFAFDRTALTQRIADATALLNSKTVGTAVGNVTQSVHDNLNTVILSATDVNSNMNSTQAQIDEQVTALTNAITVFNNGVIFGDPILKSRYNYYELTPGLKNFSLDFYGQNLNKLNGKIFKLVDGLNNIVATSESNSSWSGSTYLYGNYEITFSMRAVDMLNGVHGGSYRLVIDGVQNFYQDEQLITIRFTANKTILLQRITLATDLLRAHPVGEAFGYVTQNIYDALNSVLVEAEGINSDENSSQIQVDTVVTKLNAAISVFSDNILESDHPYPSYYDHTWTYTVPGNPVTIDVTFDSQTMVDNYNGRIYVMDGDGMNIEGSPFSGSSLGGKTVTVPGDTVKIRLTSSYSYYYGYKVTNIRISTALAKPATPVLANGIATWIAVKNENNGYLVQLIKDGDSSAASGITATTPHGVLSYDFSSFMTTSGSYSVVVRALGKGTYSNSPLSNPSLPQIVIDKRLLSSAITAAETLLSNYSVGETAGFVSQATYDVLNNALLSATGVNSDTTATQTQVDAAVAALTSGINVFNERIIGKTPESNHPYSNSYDHTWIYTVPTSPAAIDVTFDPQTSVEYICDNIYVMDGNGVNIQGSPFTGNTLAGITVTVPGDTVKIRLTSDSSVTGYGFKVTNIAVSNALAKPARPLLENGIATWTAVENENNGYCVQLYKRLDYDGFSLVTTAKTANGVLNYDFSTFMTISGSYSVTVKALGTGFYRDSYESDLSMPQIVHGAPMLNYRSNSSIDVGSKYFDLYFSGVNMLELSGKVFKIVDDQNNVVATSESTTNWTGGAYVISNNFIEIYMRAIDIGNGIPVGTYKFVIEGLQNYYENEQIVTIILTTNKTVLTQNITAAAILLNTYTVGEADGNVTQSAYDALSSAIAAATMVNTNQAASQTQIDQAVTTLVAAISAFREGIIGHAPESEHPYQNNYNHTWIYSVSGNPDAIDITFDSQTMVENGCDNIYVMDKNGANIPGSPFTGNSLSGITVTVPGDTVKIRLTSDGSATYYGFKITNLAVSNALARPAQPVLVNGIASWTAVENDNNGYSINLYRDGYTLVATGTTTQDVLCYDFSQFMIQPGSYTVTVKALGTGSWRDSSASDASVAQVVHGIPKITFKYYSEIASGTKYFDLYFGGIYLSELNGKIFKLMDDDNNVIATTEATNNWTSYAYAYDNFLRFSLRAIDMANGMPVGNYKVVIDGVNNYYDNVQIVTISFTTNKTTLAQNLTVATILLNSCKVGEEAGNVPQNVHDAFNAVILTASSVNSNEAATQVQVDAAVAALADSINTFNKGVIGVVGLESEHPYPYNCDHTWIGKVPGNPTELHITFGKLTMVNYSDNIYVMDKNGTNISGSPFTGNSLAGITVTVPGDTVRIRLTGYYNYSCYGFKVTGMTGRFVTDKNTLKTTITNALSLINSIPIGTQTGYVSQNTHDALNSVITSATEVSNNESFTQEQVDEQTAELTSAMATFRDSIIKMLDLPVLSDTTTNAIIGNPIFVTSSKNGFIYLVAKTIVNDKNAMENEVAVNRGKKIAALANVSVSISTEGLAPDIYVAYAVDTDGDLSAPSPDITLMQTENSYVEGDVDGDGVVTNLDCTLVKQFLLGEINRFTSTTGFLAADVDKDGKVTSRDYALIKKYSVK